MNIPGNIYIYIYISYIYIFSPNLGGLLLEVHFEVWGGVKLLPPCLKLVRIMLETSNLAHK